MSDFPSERIFRERIDWNDTFDHVRIPRLYIQGIEVTQAIQYYRSAQHLTDPADRAPDNAVTFIAGKPAWVRVYVRSGFFFGDTPVLPEPWK